MQYTISLFWVLLLWSVGADAYVGPGLGLGALGALFGIIFAIILAVVGVFWYPLKRLLSKLKRSVTKSDFEEVFAEEVETEKDDGITNENHK